MKKLIVALLVCLFSTAIAKERSLSKLEKECQFYTHPIADRFYIVLSKTTAVRDFPEASAKTIVTVGQGQVGIAVLENSDDLRPMYYNGHILLRGLTVAKLKGWVSTENVLAITLLADLERLQEAAFECLDNRRELHRDAFGGTFTGRGFVSYNSRNTRMLAIQMLNQETSYIFQILKVITKRFGREAKEELLELMRKKTPGEYKFNDNACPDKLTEIARPFKITDQN